MTIPLTQDELAARTADEHRRQREADEAYRERGLQDQHRRRETLEVVRRVWVQCDAKLEAQLSAARVFVNAARSRVAATDDFDEQRTAALDLVVGERLLQLLEVAIESHRRQRP